MKKRIFSRLMAMIMALALLSTSAFAASFQNLQDAINGTSSYREGHTEESTVADEEKYTIKSTTDENGKVNVTLYEDVTYGGESDAKGITTDAKSDVTLNLNGKTIDGGYDAETEKGGSGQTIITAGANSTLTINGADKTGKKGTITGGNTASWGGSTIFTSGGNVTINDTLVSGNHSNGCGGAFAFNGSNVSLNRSVISENTSNWDGGAININYGALTLNDTNIINNRAGDCGGGICSTECDIKLTGDSHIINNRSELNDIQGGIANDLLVHERLMDAYEESVTYKNGTYHKEISDDETYGKYGFKNIVYLCAHAHKASATCTAPETCTDCGAELSLALGHEYGEWYVTREARPGEAGEERRDCVRGDAFETRPIPALPMPIDFGDDFGGGDTGTTIADEETPLAGLFTRADAIGYLWEQSGSPEAELSTFADVPEDHYWAVAIGWAEDNGIALPDEEGNFRPDDLVLRTSDEPEGELQEFLNRYAVFAGIELDEGELFFVLDGAVDDIIMGEDAQVIFDAFFAKLEKTLAEQEKAA